MVLLLCVHTATKYHSSRVESIKTVTHDTKTFVLRMPPASYLSVPTGHHLSIKAHIDGKLETTGGLGLYEH